MEARRKKIILTDVFEYLPKSKYKAGDGLNSGKYPFFTSSQNQVLWLDVADYNKESLIFATGGKPSIHLATQFSTSTDNFIISSINDKVVTRYVYYYFKKNIHILEKGFKGAGLKHLSKDYLNKIDLVFPINSNGEIDVLEQNRIVKILDEAESLKNKREDANKKTNILIDALFINMFGDPQTNSMGWPLKKMVDICDIRRGASPRPIEKFIGGDVPWIKIGDGTNGDNFFIKETKVKITQEGAKKSVLLKPESIIFANCGVSLGFARILKISGCIHDGWLAFENIDASVDKIFLLKYINHLTLYLRKLAPDGTQPNLNTGIMKNLKIFVPPIDLQNKFSKLVLALENEKEKQKKSAEKINILFDSLMQKVFSI